MWIAGHSLGAAEAALYAWHRIKNNLPVAGVYLFGCPNPGDSSLRNGVSFTTIWRSIKNGRDLVTDVPVDIAAAGEEYVQIAPFEETNEPPPAGDWGPFRYHHIDLYVAGSRKLPLAGSSFLPVNLMAAVTAVSDLYDGTPPWAWTHFVNGQYCAMRQFTSGVKLLVFRGSTTALDWLHDFEAEQITVDGSRIEKGFWAGVAPILSQLDAL